MTKQDIEFVEGLSFQPPRAGAPEYVKARGWIKNAELIDFLKARIAKGEASTNFDLKESKGGKLYASVDNFKPDRSKGGARPSVSQYATSAEAKSAQDAFDSQDIPF